MPLAQTEPRTPEATLHALQELVQSDGWSIYEAAMRTQWSAESYEAAVRKLYAEAQPGDDVTALVAQINATYEGMRKMLEWPREYIRSLKAGKQAEAPGRFKGRFAWLGEKEK